MVKMVMANCDHFRRVSGFRDASPKLIDRFEFKGVRRQTKPVRAKRYASV
jgi:hypothetical protein